MRKIKSKAYELGDNYIQGIDSLLIPSDLGHVVYADAAGNNPVDGLGGSPNITWTKNTVDPLAGSVDLLLTKDANNRRGQGVSIPFTIDNRHLATVLQITGDAVLRSGVYTSRLFNAVATYSVNGSNQATVVLPNTFTTGTLVTVVFETGGATALSDTFTLTGATSTNFTFNLTTATTNGNCRVFYVGDLRASVIEDPSGTPVVNEPVGTDIQLAVVGQSVKFIATFQTSRTIRNYRLCFHVSGSTSNAFEVSFSNIKVWEQEKNYGAFGDDFKPYTPVFTGYTGSTITSHLRYKREFNGYRIMGSWVPSGGSNSSTSILSFTLPEGKTADLSQFSRDYIVGSGWRNASSSSSIKGLSCLIDTANPQRVVVSQIHESRTISPFSDSSASTNITALEEIGVNIFVPIAGFGSNMALSSDAGSGRSVSGLVTGHTGVSLTASVTNIRFNTIQKDSHGIYNTSTGIITIPESGDYIFTLQGLRQTTPGSYPSIAIYVNGALRLLGNSIGIPSDGGFGGIVIIKGVDLRSGDQVSFRIEVNRTSETSTNASLSWEKVNAGSQILARDESVFASYYSGANQTSLTTQINFGIRVEDSHGAVTTGAGWRFTAPVSGVYQINHKCGGSASTSINLFKNNSQFVNMGFIGTGMGGYLSCGVGIKLLAGEFIDLRPNSSATVNGNVSYNNIDATRIEIVRIGAI